MPDKNAHDLFELLRNAQAAGGAAPSAPAATHDLAAIVRMRLEVWVSPPLNAVPGPLLGSAGGLLLRLLLQVGAQKSLS